MQITVAEEEGLTHRDAKTGEVTGSRIGYYEGVGALRDMVQNHMLQVLCLVAMEPPWSLEPDVVRDAKTEVLHCLRPLTHGRRRPLGGRGPSTSPATCTARTCPATVTRSASSSPIAQQADPAGVHHRNLRGHAAVHRQLALGGRAVLPAHRQAPAQARASEVAIQFKDVPQILFNATPGRAAGADRAVAAHAAGGGHVAAHRLQAARAQGAHLSR